MDGEQMMTGQLFDVAMRMVDGFVDCGVFSINLTLLLDKLLELYDEQFVRTLTGLLSYLCC